MSGYDWEDDAKRCYGVAHAALREIKIRMGLIEPDPQRPGEVKWAEEGITGIAHLDTVREDRD